MLVPIDGDEFAEARREVFARDQFNLEARRDGEARLLLLR